MANFSFRALDGSGRLVEGERVGSDRAEILGQLRQEGFQPLQIEERKARGLSLTTTKKRPTGLDENALALFARELATLLMAGLPLEQGLVTIAQQDGGKGASAEIATTLLKKVRSGSSFADALASKEGVFPGHFIGLVRAGEAGGTLEQVMASLADTLERARTLRQEIKAALNYPIMVLVAAGGSILVLLLGVIPEFEPLFAGAGDALPFSARLVLGVSRGLREFWWAIPAIIFLVFILLKSTASNSHVRARLDGMLLDMPMIGPLLRKIEASRFCSTLGTLLKNGVDVVPALQMSIGTLSNGRLITAVEQVVPKLRRGEGLATPLEQSGLLPPLALRLLRIGESSGQLDVMLMTTARIYEGDISRDTKKMVGMLVPAVTLFLGIVVAGIIGSILSAILTSYDLPF